MIVVMRPTATQDEIDGVRRIVEEHGLEAFLSVGEERTVIGVVGKDIERVSHLGTLAGVEQVIRISSPYKLASIEHQVERTRVRINGVQIGEGQELVVIAGPCAVESREQLFETARCVKREGARVLRGGAFKPRTSPYSFQGLGLPGLKLLAEAHESTGLPVVSEVVDPADVPAFEEYIDVLQVGARNMHNFALLKAVGQSRRPVLLKRGLSATIEEWLLAAEYVMAAGNPNVILCERGIRTFETATRNTLDLSAVPVLRSRTHLPITVDPSHGTGHRALVAPMALASAAVGADGLIIEVHPDPANARSDGDQSLGFEEFGALMDELRRLQFVRSGDSARAPSPAQGPARGGGHRRGPRPDRRPRRPTRGHGSGAGGPGAGGPAPPRAERARPRRAARARAPGAGGERDGRADDAGRAHDGLRRVAARLPRGAAAARAVGDRGGGNRGRTRRVTPASTSHRILPAARLRGRLTLPADKSIAHRALIFGALSGGPATVTMHAPGRDVLSTVECLRALGVSIATDPEGRYAISGRPSRDATLDCGNSGTTMRLLAGALAGLPLRATLDGDESLRARPMERVADVLRAAGADVTTTDGHAPLTVVGHTPLTTATHRLPVASAQLLGAAVLAGMRATGETSVETPGPTRDHTERMLAFMGVPIHRDGRVTTVTGPALPRPSDLAVPGDPSAAAAWLVAAALHPDAELTMTGVGLNPTRLGLLGLLQRMGAEIETRVTDVTGPEPVGDISVRGGRPLHALTISGGEVADLLDELPLIAIAMASVDEPSELRDASELRVKETDRISAVVAGLAAVGADAVELADGWRVRRGTPRAGVVTTHGDHRIAIAFAIAAVTGVAAGVELDDPDCVGISYPAFWDDLAAVTA